MTEEELKALIEERINKAAEDAAKAAETVEQPQEAPRATEGDAQPKEDEKLATYTAEDLKQAIEAAAKATIKLYEEKLRDARRPPYGAPILLRQRAEPKPIYWAVKAALRNQSGSVVLRDVPDGVMFTSGAGDESAVKAFIRYAQEAGADVQGNILYGVAAKAMSTTSGGAVGEHFIDRVNSRPVVEALYQEVITRQLPGVDIYPMPALVCDAPTIGSFTAGWSAENANATSAGDAATGRKTLTARNLTAWAELSNQLLSDSNPGVEQYVRSGLAGAMGEVHDIGAIRGSGTGAEPTGLINEAGVTSTAAGTDNFYVAVSKAVGRMAANKIPTRNIAVICRPEVITKTSITQVGTSGDYLTAATPMGALLDNAFTGPVSRRLGLPVFATTALEVATNQSSILVLHCPSWTIGDRQELEIASSNVAGNAFRNNQTYVRAIMRVDFNLKRAKALEIITGFAH